MTGDAQPQLVCPRCGEPAHDTTGFCQRCGLNLAKQGELLSAEEFAARKREERWLAERGDHESESPAAARVVDQRGLSSRISQRWPLAAVAAAIVLVVAVIVIAGGGDSSRDTAGEPTDSRSAGTGKTTDCGDITHGTGIFVGNIQATGLTCDEAKFVVAGFHHMDPVTAEPLDGDSPVEIGTRSDGKTETARYEFAGESRTLRYSFSSSGDEAGTNSLTDDERFITWSSGA